LTVCKNEKKLKMKKLLFIPVFVFALISCELIKDAAKIDIESEFKVSFQIDLEQDDTTINEVQVIYLTEDSDVNKYKKNIDDLKVDSVVISIANYTGPDVQLISGNISYSKTDKNEGTVFANIIDLDIADMFANDKTINLDYDKSQIVKAAEIMLKDLELKVYLDASVKEVPSSFKLVVKFHTTIVAQPLD
jgi:hypothetical protein